MEPSWTVATLQWLGMVMPAFFAGVTFQYSLTYSALLEFAPPRILAKQWLRIYQFGPAWVIPTVLLGTAANGWLAALVAGSERSAPAAVYGLAAAVIFSILPVTFLYFEPGINGACKWKVESLLRDEGFRLLPPARSGRPSSVRHSATEASKRWADGSTMQDLVRYWGKVNHMRWVTGVVAAVLSGWASLCSVYILDW